jgi:anaerobic selenocysteine-containing dehydrogenase
MAQSKEWNRREFLAAACAFCGTTPCLFAEERSRFLNYVGAKEAVPVEQHLRTLCSLCPGGCGLQVRTVHGCAVGVRGNPWHPVNQGGLCARASAVLHELYHPERLLRPRQRLSARGEGGWQDISWEAAIRLISDRLATIRKTPGPQALLTLLGRDRGLTRVGWERFMRAFGSPNLVVASAQANLGAVPAIMATQGLSQRIGYDLANASFVLSFSSQWLDAHWCATQASRGYAEFRRSRPSLRPRWVHVEPRLSLTGSKADEWVPVRPGTEGALALSLAHVIVREGLHDQEFIQQRCHGFEDWVDTTGATRIGFRRLVLQEYTPAHMQDITGVPEGTIFRLAREFCQHRPALAIGYDEDDCGALRCYDRMAIHCLNALVGSIDVPGGVTVFQPFSLLAPVEAVDETAQRGLLEPRVDGSPSEHLLAEVAWDKFPDAILRAQPYAIEALFLVDSNPVFSSPAGQEFVKALRHVPLVVSFANFLDDSNRYADLIVPGLHSLERWDFDLTHTLTGHSVFSVARPTVAAPEKLVHPYELLRTVASTLGPTMAASFPWKTPLEAVQGAARELFNAGHGAPFGPAHEEAWAQLLESRGWRAPFAETFEAFWQDVLAGGGWTDPIYDHEAWDRVFKSPARRFAFHSEVLERAFQIHAAPAGVSGELRCLPHYEPLPAETSGRFPLHLYVYSLPTLAHTTNPHLAWLNDISGAYQLQRWSTWVEINPQTAKEYGIHDGQQVLLSTPRGATKLPARVFAGIMPGVLAVPFGFGHEVDGRWAAIGGVNPARLVTSLHDSLSGSSYWNGTRAALAKT